MTKFDKIFSLPKLFLSRFIATHRSSAYRVRHILHLALPHSHSFCSSPLHYKSMPMCFRATIVNESLKVVAPLTITDFNNLRWKTNMLVASIQHIRDEHRKQIPATSDDGTSEVNSEIIAELDRFSRVINDHILSLNDHSPLKMLLMEKDVSQIINDVDEIFYDLQELGNPAHFSMIADQLDRLLSTTNVLKGMVDSFPLYEFCDGKSSVPSFYEGRNLVNVILGVDDPPTTSMKSISDRVEMLVVAIEILRLELHFEFFGGEASVPTMTFSSLRGVLINILEFLDFMIQRVDIFQPSESLALEEDIKLIFERLRNTSCHVSKIVEDSDADTDVVWMLDYLLETMLFKAKLLKIVIDGITAESDESPIRSPHDGN